MMLKRGKCVPTAVCVLMFLGQAAIGQVVWVDNFDGPEIDRTIWTYNTGGSGFGNGELQYYTANCNNAYIENGNLVIEAFRGDYNGKSFTSSRLNTHGRLAFKYGTLTARIKVPDLEDGLWPAFWLLGDNFGQADWPGCGEVDILEMGMDSAIQAHVTNRRVAAAAHWDIDGNYASYGLDTTSTVPLNNDYHLYSLSWTPSFISVSLDGVPFWTIDINNPASASLEEFHEPMFILLNLAVGGFNFVNITDPNQITAPFPAKLYVDYVQLSANPWTEVYFADGTAEEGLFGLLTETVPVNDSVSFGVDAEFYVWNNMVGVPGSAYEGADAWNFNIGAGDWFGGGVYCMHNRNLMNYTNGNLHFHMKTASTETIGIGIASGAGGEGWVDLVDGGEQYGLVRDGQWHEVVMPCSLFANVDFNTVIQPFMMRGGSPSAAFSMTIDNVYFEPDQPKPTPQFGNFGVFTESAANSTAGEFLQGADGQFYIWENTLSPISGSPYEGGASLSFATAGGSAWFGAAFTPFSTYDLSAFRYPESTLRFALQTTSATTFQIGLKSGTQADISQQWIRFEQGNDPYGFVRDGQWHVIEIPMSDFTCAVDLQNVTQLFELLGTDGAISNIHIDDIAFINGGAAIGVDLMPGDANGDGLVDGDDYSVCATCLGGPSVMTVPAGCMSVEFDRCDLDGDGDADLRDQLSIEALMQP